MKPIIFWLLVAAVLSSLNACSSMSAMNDSLRSKRSCCTSFRDLPYVEVDAANKMDFSSSDSSPVFQFPEGKSFFMALRLPQSLSPGVAELEVRFSRSILDPYMGTVRAFCPAYTLLRDDFSEIKSSAVQVHFAASTWTKGARWVGQIVIPDGTRYIVLHTTDDLLEGSVNMGPHGGYISPYTDLGPGVYTSMHSDGNTGNVFCAPDANLSIQVRGLQS